MAAKGVTVKDVPADKFIAAYARYLKRSGRVEAPKWVDVVKTGHFKELSPYDPDWFFVRSASIARKVYLRQNIGVGRFRRIYGGKKRNGSRPPHRAIASGAVISAAVKQLEKLQVIQPSPKGGRIITQTGQRDLDRIAAQVLAALAKTEAAAAAAQTKV